MPRITSVPLETRGRTSHRTNVAPSCRLVRPTSSVAVDFDDLRDVIDEDRNIPQIGSTGLGIRQCHPA